MELTENEKQQLLSIARTVIECNVKMEKIPEFKPSPGVLLEKCGAFVTIHKSGALRGCIGLVEAMKPLYQTVAEMAKAAAFDDPRFSRIIPDELDELEIEISALSPIREIGDIKEIEIGKHGIIIQQGANRGLLLPQVATEYGWDRITFLEHTCQKAGLPKNVWRDAETVIKIFSATVFGEKS